MHACSRVCKRLKVADVDFLLILISICENEKSCPAVHGVILFLLGAINFVNCAMN